MNNFEKAFEMSMNDWLSTIPDIVPEAEYTKNHDKWLKNLLNKMRDNKYHTFTTKTIKVLLVAAVLCALLLTAFVVPSSREFIVDHFDIFSRYKLTESNNNAVNGEITVGYIPEGFKLTNEQELSRLVMNDYTDSNGGIFIVSKYSSSTEVDFDTELGSVKNSVINGITYMFYIDENNHNILVWNKNDYVYQIDGNLPKDELLKIAETVK